MNHTFRTFSNLSVQGTFVISDSEKFGPFSTPEAAAQVVILLRSPNWTPTRNFVLTTDDWNQCRAAGAYQGQGYFVDWNGKVREIHNPGERFSYDLMINVEAGHVNVIESDGGEIFQADYHPTLDSLRARGINV